MEMGKQIKEVESLKEPQNEIQTASWSLNDGAWIVWNT